MTTEEKKIEESAKAYADNHRLSVYSGGWFDKEIKDFTNGAKSDAAKEYHTKGMITKEEVLSFFEKYEPNLAITILKSEFVEWFDKNKTV